MKNSNGTMGNRTRDLPACSAMPQPTALLRAPQEDLYMQFYGISFVHPYKQSGRWQDVLDAKVLRLAIDQTAYMGA